MSEAIWSVLCVPHVSCLEWNLELLCVLLRLFLFVLSSLAHESFYTASAPKSVYSRNWF